MTATKILLILLTIITVAALGALLATIHYKVRQAVISLAHVNMALCYLLLSCFQYKNLTGSLSPLLPALACAVLTCTTFLSYVVMIVWARTHVSSASILDSFNKFELGLCYYTPEGRVLLCNTRMQHISHCLFGEMIFNGLEFQNRLHQLLPNFSSPVPCGDGTTVSFSLKTINGGRHIELSAADVTEYMRLNRELTRDNEQLRLMNNRLRKYGKLAEEVTREQEILNAKIRIHDNLGNLLLTTQKVLYDGTSTDRAQLLAQWHENLLLLAMPKEEAQSTLLDRLADTAESVGVALHYTGTLPEDDEDLMQLIGNAVQECLTNTIIHAAGSNLFIALNQLGPVLQVTLTNDGKQPVSPIKEGGGLANLRRKVERAGGTMEIGITPQFHVTLLLPNGSAEPA